jgi:hypothetical protein
VDDYTMEEANAASPEQLRSHPVFLHEPTAMFSPVIDPDDVNDILPKGVPALSHGAGHNRVNGAVRNYDAEENEHKPNGWGRSGGEYDTRWLHGDFKNMAYFYTYDLFDQIVSEGELR